MLNKLMPDWFKIFYYKSRGRIPWSRGYNTYKWKIIRGTLSNKELMKLFKEGKALPVGYGARLDVRVVEYPWLFSRLSQTPEKMLDAGSSLNYQYILELLKSLNKDITIINLNPEPESFPEKRISYIFGDMRDMPFRDNYFDCIICISTFQHIGMDNTGYLNDKQYREQSLWDFEKVTLELKRVVRGGAGFLLLFRLENIKTLKGFSSLIR